MRLLKAISALPSVKMRQKTMRVRRNQLVLSSCGSFSFFQWFRIQKVNVTDKCGIDLSLQLN